MADNVAAPAIDKVFATDEIATVHYPRNKIGYGEDGAYADVTETNRFPVADVAVAALLQALVDAGSGGGGTVGGSTEATLVALSAKLPSSLGAKAASGSLSITPATGSDLATNAALATIVQAITAAVYYPATQPVSGTVGIAGTVPVSGTFFQATQPVSIAAPVAVTGTFYQATQPISAASLPLPSGASTAANQATVITALQNSAPADDLFTITPSDTVALGTIPKALLVTVAGNVAVRGTGASPVTLAVTAGQILPIRARYVYATNTTATVVGLV